jgi:serine/threonine-protein kinase
VLHQIGVGVLGPVYRTYDPDGDRLVAVKVFKVDITPEQAETLAAQLNRIAQIGLSEPGLVAPLTAGVEGTAAYLAQEYVAAESLDVALRHYAPASIDRAAPFISQLAGAIDGARAVGAQHGALHPRDVFVTPDSARATGFGVVPALEEIGVRGPVRRPYTAPERVGGGEWGPGADIFSLAVIAFELLTGKRPAGTGAEVAAQLREEGIAADADALEALFASALADDPDDRPRTAHEFASAFEALGAPGSAARPAAAEPAPTVDLTATELTLSGDAAPAAFEADEVSTAPADAALSAEDDELAAWLASSDSKKGAEVPPSASEVEQILSTPEASEAEVKPAPPAAPERSKASLFEDWGIDEVEPQAQEAAPEPPAPEPPAPEPPFVQEEASTGQQEDDWGVGATDDPPPAEVAPEPVVDLEEEKPSRRAPSLPFALALVVAILIAFVTGYVLRSDDPAEPGQAPAADVAGQGQAPAAAAPEVPPAVDVEPPPPVVAAEPPPAPVSEPTVDVAAGDAAPPVETPAAPELAPVTEVEPEVDVGEAPGLRADVAPAPVVGRLLIRSSPPGAQVVVNEAAAGITPLAMADLAYGDYVIRISRAGYRVELLSVSISADEPVAALNLDLIESGDAPAAAPPAGAPSPDAAPGLAGESGTLVIDTRPAGAEVYVDGRLLGATPVTLVDVPTGAHTIRLLRSGYREWTTTVEIESGQQLRVAASLEGAP